MNRRCGGGGWHAMLGMGPSQKLLPRQKCGDLTLYMTWKSVITIAIALCASVDALRLTNIDYTSDSDHISDSVPDPPAPQEFHLENNTVRVVNECAKSDLNECSPDAACIQHDNDYECQCSPGYKDTSGDTGLPPGRLCVKNNDPCEGATRCGRYSKCVPTNDAYTCQCNDGYVEVKAAPSKKRSKKKSKKKSKPQKFTCKLGPRRVEPVNLLPNTSQVIIGCTQNEECNVDRKEICSKNTCVCPDHLNRDATSGKCESRCTDQLTDLIFLLDGSGSVTEKVFKKDVLPFVKAFTKTFEIGPNKTRVGIVQYSDTLRVEFHLKKHNDRKSLEKAIAKIHYMDGGTDTGKAIEFMTQYVFTEGNGSRPLSSGVRRVAIIITDGQSYDNVRFPAHEARLSDISLFAVGVTSGVNMDELLDIAGDKSQYSVVQSFKQLDLNLRSKIQAKVCTDSTTSLAQSGRCKQDSDCSSDRNEVCDNGVCACPKKFLRNVASGQCDSKCNQQPTDLIFLIHRSYPMVLGYVKDVIPFVLAFTKAFDIGLDKTRVALMLFNDTVDVRFHLNAYNDRNSLEREILSTVPSPYSYYYLGSLQANATKFNTGRAIEFMSRYGFSEGNGSRPLSADVKRVAIVITSGRSDDSVDGPAKEAKANGILLFGISISQNASSHNSNESAAFDESKYIAVSAFKDFDWNLKRLVQSEVCTGNTQEEIIAESYDDEQYRDTPAVGQQSVMTIKSITTYAPGCPNKNNPFHLCVDFCHIHWGDGVVQEARRDQAYERRRQRMLRRYPLPSNDWREVYDPGFGHYYYWNMETDEVSWLSPTHPKAKIGVAAAKLAKVEWDKLKIQEEQRKRQQQREQERELQLQESGRRPRGKAPKRRSVSPESGGESGQSGGESEPEGDDEERGRRKKPEKRKLPRDLDPMDPAAYSEVARGGWSAGLETKDDAVTGVDTTASGPLFQQRPYPAPGAILRKSKGPPKKKQMLAKGPMIGPVIPGANRQDDSD